MQLLPAIGREKEKKIRERAMSINWHKCSSHFLLYEDLFSSNYRIFQRTECDLTASLKLSHYTKKGNKKKVHHIYYALYFEEVV